MNPKAFKSSYLLGALAAMIPLAVSCSPASPPAVETQKPELSKAVVSVLERKIRLLEGLLSEHVIIETLRESNLRHAETTQTDILLADKEWRASTELSDFVKGFIINACATRLVQFQDAHAGFAEIFVTNAKGLNACQTNRTTDYYQADEAWWQETYNEGAGHAYYGEIEYDESARSEAIGIFAPVRDVSERTVIGIAKAVIPVSDIKKEIAGEIP
ncbi:MAG: hypothetical protein Q8R76_07015 [Candidatus Omnitrophota bacterium]|nr:hypothetical protein [Candidatus Omnitrophota bacterium]